MESMTITFSPEAWKDGDGPVTILNKIRGFHFHVETETETFTGELIGGNPYTLTVGFRTVDADGNEATRQLPLESLRRLVYL